MKDKDSKPNIIPKLFIAVFAFVLFIFNLGVAKAAMLYFDPASGDYGAGDTFVVNLRIDNENECINAVDASIQFPTDLLRVVDFSRGSSILSLWIKEPEIDNEKGIVSFSGGIPAGYCGRITGDPALSNILGKIIFSVLPEVQNLEETGFANIEISPESQVLLNDGLGTPAKVSVQNADFLIHSSPVLSQNEWLNELKNDQTLPEPFDVIIQRDSKVYSGKYYIVFSTVDKQSGLDYFEVFENGQWRRAESPYLLKNQNSTDQLQVRAFDKAGNERPGNKVMGQTQLPETKNYYFYALFLLGILIIVAIWAYNKHKQNKSNEI